VKKIRCNNSGENVVFQAKAKREGLGLNFEFTAHQTPQQNRQVECKFATLFGRVWAARPCWRYLQDAEPANEMNLALT